MIKKKSLLTLLVVPSFILGGCSKGNRGSTSMPEPEYYKTTLNVEMEPFINKEIEKYDLEFSYSDGYFFSNPDEYNKDLSLLSFGASMVTDKKEKAEAFYTSAQFSDVVSHGYEGAPTSDSIGYTFAHKVVEGYDVVAITVRGLNYGMEWSNNFIIGKTGNHEGFNARAIDIYQELTQYVSSKCTLNNLKIWISGYSRGGAVANVLADTIVKGESVEVSANGLYTYTFEAPAGIDSNNIVAYPFVHNVINSNDVVANIPPASYGLGRCGVDYEIYDENVSTIMSAFDEKAIIPEYSPVTLGGVSYNNDTELVEHLLENIFDKEDSSAEYAVNTRSDYVDKVQPSLSHMIGYIFGLTAETRQSLIDDLKNKSIAELFSVMASQESLATFLETYLDRDSVIYNHEQLVEDCGILSAVLYLFNEVLSLYLDSETAPVLSRLISMHYTEVVYTLLINEHNKENTASR